MVGAIERRSAEILKIPTPTENRLHIPILRAELRTVFLELLDVGESCVELFEDSVAFLDRVNVVGRIVIKGFSQRL